MSREERRRFAVLARVRRALDEFYRAQDIGEGYSITGALEKVLELAMHELEFKDGHRARRALIVLPRPEGEGGPLEVSAGWGEREDHAFSRTVMDRVVETGQSQLIHDAGEDPRFRDVESLRGAHLLSVLAIPLKVEGKALGALYLDSTDRAAGFDSDDVDFLEAFAETIAPHLKSAWIHQRHLAEIRRLRAGRENQEGFGGLIGRGSSMRALFDLARRVAADPFVRVLVEGESGTGKELLARGIHTEGPRATGRFMAVNCAAIPRDLLESELFGHERGAFTGAVQRRIGRFEEADGGTMFLDEIGDLDLDLQAKLLRVLETETFQRVGGNADIRVEVRVITATHRSLPALVAEGRFREDLYHRLNVVPLRLPPLRERPEDIPLLAHHFVEKFNQRKDRTVRGFTPRAMEALVGLEWRGNVRELENAVERCHLLCPGDWMDLEQLPGDLRGSVVPAGRVRETPSPFSEDLPLREMSRRYVREVVARCATKAEACRVLGITDKTLNRLLLGE